MVPLFFSFFDGSNIYFADCIINTYAYFFKILFFREKIYFLSFSLSVSLCLSLYLCILCMIFIIINIRQKKNIESRYFYVCQGYTLFLKDLHMFSHSQQKIYTERKQLFVFMIKVIPFKKFAYENCDDNLYIDKRHKNP